MAETKPCRTEAELRIPRDCVINNQRWYILIKSIDEYPELEGHAGLTVWLDDKGKPVREIILNKEIMEDYGQVVIVLLHEVMHAIVRGHKIPKPPKNKDFCEWEHYFIYLLEDTLPVVMHNNPELSQFLFARGHVDKDFKTVALTSAKKKKKKKK